MEVNCIISRVISGSILIGSNTDSCVRDCSTSVIITKPTSTLPSKESPTVYMACTDGSSIGKHVIDTVSQITKQGDELHLIFVSESRGDEGFGLTKREKVEEDMNKVQEEAEVSPFSIFYNSTHKKCL